jgi:hypothetical protein
MKQTAVEWLVEQLFELRNPTLNQIEIMKQAEKMEKQQIIDAHIKGHNAPSSTIKNYDAEQYYNEQFNKK